MFECKDCRYCKMGNYLEYKCPCFRGFPHGNYNIQKLGRDDVSQMYEAYCLLNGFRKTKNEKKAVAILKKLDKNDFAPAQYILSDCYFRGIVVKQDLAMAFYWCKKAADHRCNLAVVQTYKNYMSGIGVEQDLKLAKKYCGIAVALENIELYFTYAEMCYSEEYGETSPKDACRYYRKAYENGVQIAYEKLKELHQNHIKECYESQNGIISDDHLLAIHSNEKFADFCVNNEFFHHIKTAIKHYRIALSFALKKSMAREERNRKIEENSSMDRYERQAYEYDKYFDRFDIEINGGPKTVERIEKKIEDCLSCYFEEFDTNNKELFKSALLGQAWAQNNIGCLFFDPEYDMHDYEEAKKWFARSAKQGNEKAIENLEICKKRIATLSKTRSTSNEHQTYVTDHNIVYSNDYGHDQISAHREFLEKALSGTLTQSERDRYDHEYGG